MKKLFLFVFLSFAIFSCDDSEDTLTGNENVGGYSLLADKYQSISYVVGNGLNTEYPVMLRTIQEPITVKTINVYKQFYKKTIVNGVTVFVKSNKVLYKTFNIDNSTYNVDSDVNPTFNSLVQGLNVNGIALSTDDQTYTIGDYWELTYETIQEDGSVRYLSKTSKIAVSTRFAGRYKCLDGLYYRIGVLTYTTANWPTETVIESVDATTYRVKKYFGPFSNTSTATGGDYYFRVDASDNISYPATTPDGIAQQGNGQPFMTCAANSTEFQVLSCANTNKVERDNVNGKDILYMTFGYLNGPGQGREFYQKMQKIVD